MTDVNILMIDDRPENLLALEAILDNQGYNLVKAFSGSEALRHLLNRDFAAILLDAQMPGMDGFETATLIREREKTQHIPIIFMTAINRTEQHIFKGYAVGAVDYLFKPLVPEILKAKVAFFVESFKMTQENQRQAQEIEAMNAALQRQLREVQRLNLKMESTNRQLQESSQRLKSALDRAQAAERAKDTLLSNVTHEMRTPLSSIIGFSNLILQRAVTENKNREFATAINHEARRLMDLVNNFLDLQKLEAGHHNFHFGLVDLAELAQDVVGKQHLDNGRHTIRMAFDEVPPVYADGERIRQVMVNLLSNAIKYSPDGGEIVLSLQHDGRQVCFSVQDHGVGIPQEELGHLFERFHRGQTAEQLRLRGTGLGLALCKELIEGHRGRIWAESAGQQRGSTFSFALLCVQEGDSMTRIGQGYTDTDTKRVLVVAENLQSVTGVIAHLELEGFAVQSLVYQEATPPHIAQLAPDAILLDVSQDDERAGWSILDELRRYPMTQDIPILVSAENTDLPGENSIGLLTGLAKPLDAGLLVHELAHVLRLHKRRVLVIESDDLARDMLHIALDRAGYEMIAAADGQAAMDYMREAWPDLLIMDVLPDVDGFALLDWVRLEQGNLDIPILVWTGAELSPLAAQKVQARANALALKSKTTPQQVVDLIEHLMAVWI
ncbi:MAG: response regulator [Anaerolineae bacterium]|nr:response regulator [Anaerolineae bacterium]